MQWRRALSITVAVLAFGAMVWLASYASAPTSAASAHAVQVTGPEGPIWNGTVNGTTPLEVLHGAAAAGDFDVAVRGSGASAYVVAIDGHEEGAGGWCFLVGDAHGWSLPGVGAGAYGLDADEAVWWTWTDGRCEDVVPG